MKPHLLKKLDCDVLLATSHEKESSAQWVLVFGCTYRICTHKDLFSMYDVVDSSVVNMANDA